jgi:hypothetical protein
LGVMLVLIFFLTCIIVEHIDQANKCAYVIYQF